LTLGAMRWLGGRSVRRPTQVSKIKAKATDQFNPVTFQAEDIANHVADQRH